MRALVSMPWPSLPTYSVVSALAFACACVDTSEGLSLAGRPDTGAGAVTLDAAGAGPDSDGGIGASDAETGPCVVDKKVERVIAGRNSTWGPVFPTDDTFYSVIFTLDDSGGPSWTNVYRYSPADENWSRVTGDDAPKTILAARGETVVTSSDGGIWNLYRPGRDPVNIFRFISEPVEASLTDSFVVVSGPMSFQVIDFDGLSLFSQSSFVRPVAAGDRVAYLRNVGGVDIVFEWTRSEGVVRVGSAPTRVARLFTNATGIYAELESGTTGRFPRSGRGWTEVDAGDCEILDTDDRSVLLGCGRPPGGQFPNAFERLVRFSPETGRTPYPITRWIVSAAFVGPGAVVAMRYPDLASLCTPRLDRPEGDVVYSGEDPATTEVLESLSGSCQCCGSLWAPPSVVASGNIAAWSYGFDARIDPASGIQTTYLWVRTCDP